MPTDALTYNANLLAPAAPSTNFFDPTATQSVLARYANTRIANEGSQTVAQAASRLAASRMQRVEDARRAKLWDREDQAYQERQDAKAQRGQFLEAFGRIDPNSEDYENQMDELRKTMPPELFKDDAIQDMKTAKDRIFYDRLQRRERDAEQRDREAEWKRRNIEAMQNRAAEMGAPKEVYEGSFDEDGVFNPMKFHEGVGAWKRGLAETEARKEAEKERTEKTKDVVGTATKQVEQHVADVRAFPRHAPGILAAAGASGPTDLKSEDRARYDAAKARDTNAFDAEMSAAREYKNPEEYVALVSDLTEPEKQKRRELWTVANFGRTEPGRTEPGTPKPEVSRKPLTRAVADEYLFKAKNDKKKAAEMAAADGYDVNSMD